MQSAIFPLAAATLALAGVLLPSCGLTPATTSRIESRFAMGRDTDHASLEQLLVRSLENPNRVESAHALGHFVEEWKEQRSGSNEGEVTVRDGAGKETRYAVTFATSHGVFPLTYFDEVSPAIDYRVKRIDHNRREGLGAPLVALRENTKREPIERFYPPEAITRPVTAVIRQGRPQRGVTPVTIELLCPLMESYVTTPDGKKEPLAADYTVPWARLLERAGDLKSSEWNDTFQRQPKHNPQLYMLEQYDPDKEPLIMIHGLFSSPLGWAKLSNRLWADEKIRNRYQIWHFHYNTSAPALYSGRILRTQLRELRELLDPSGRDPAMRSTTLIAHSMGGLVSRSLITQPKNVFWDAAFTQSFDSLELSASDRKMLKEAFFWQPETHVKRVIYVATPHRGSNFADNPIGRLGRWLVKPPNRFGAFYDRISAANPGAFTPEYAALGSGILDSVDALSPKQPTLKILASLPNSHRVSEHSIIGNRGKSGPLGESSDGIVDYWSSHIDRARSEKIVASGHGAVDHPDSVAEIKRILKLR